MERTLVPLHHPRATQLQAAAKRCKAEAVHWRGTVFRSTTLRYRRGRDIASGEGSRLHGGRWNPPGNFPALYASLEPETAMEETLAHYRHYQIPEHAAMPRLFVAIDVRLSAVLDFRDGSLRQRFRVSRDRMVMLDWRAEQARDRVSLTQALGWAVYSQGLEGLLVPSAARREGANLVCFPENLRPTSRLRVLVEKDQSPV